MIKSLVVIGIGSFGGFFAENLSRLQGLKSLTIIDSDIVEIKNTNTSIYRLKDVGKYKVDALGEIIQFYTDISIIKCNLNYEEGRVRLPPNDLVLDCRDVITSRKREIDAKFYISFRKLIVDCRKDSKTNERRGRYIDSITKTDIMNAAFHAFLLVSNGILFDLIKRQDVHSIDLDNSIVSKDMTVYNGRAEHTNTTNYTPSTTKLANLNQSLPRIINEKLNKPISVYVGTREFPYSITEIPACNIISYESTAKALIEIVNNVPLIYDNYVIRFVSRDNEKYIELLPETGGA